MASFAVDRNSMNRGTGEKSGVWIFEEFMFADSVFGRVVVEYDATAVRVKNEDREVRALIAPPLYDMQISGANVTIAEAYDDDGNTVWSLAMVANAKSEQVQKWRDEAVQVILDAFAVVQSDVIDFEMGLM